MKLRIRLRVQAGPKPRCDRAVTNGATQDSDSGTTNEELDTGAQGAVVSAPPMLDSSTVLLHYHRDQAGPRTGAAQLDQPEEPDHFTALDGRPVDPTVLERVLARALELGPAGVAAFDLDSTLLNNKPRQTRIVREAGQLLGEARLFGCVPDHFINWSLEPPLQKLGFLPAEITQLIPKIRQIWKERFFTSTYCENDVATLGAVDFLKRILTAGSVIAYCTGRHEGMRSGTVACLAREGFPVPDAERVHLLMKPTIEMHDDAFKISARGPLAALGTVFAVFDNEPTHINNFFSHFGSAHCVHLLTDDSGRGCRPHAQIPSVRDFGLS